jgi:RNA polymerase primary sigma factor
MRQLKISQSITSRESPSFEKYLKDLGKIPLLSAEEEVILAGLIRNGDKSALHRLVKANLRFVISVAKQFQGQGLSLSDLINEGNIGLMKAAERFDETRGFKFISFAVWWIRQSILDGLASHARLIRIPMNKVFLSSRIRKAHSALEQQLERQPSEEELAEAMNIGLVDIAESNRHTGLHVSLDAPSKEDEESNLLDVIINSNAISSEDELFYAQSLNEEIKRSMSILPERQRETICFFYGIGHDHAIGLDDIARKYDLTIERVRQIKDVGLDQLKKSQHFNSLRSFLGA